MFEKQRLLDIIKHFILFQTDGREMVKILAGYHQYHAVNKAVNCTRRAASEDGDRKIGVIWHTQGSGKSLLMVFYTGKLVLSMDNPTIVVITDRNDLDDQLYTTFCQSKSLCGRPRTGREQEPPRNCSQGKPGYIFTTIHKFAPEEKGIPSRSLPQEKRDCYCR